MNLGYTKDESYIGNGRVDDLKQVSLQNFHKMYTFPFFFDAWGTEASVLIIILLFVGVFELIGYCVRRNQGNPYGFFAYKLRLWPRWNLFLACFFGSTTSLIFNCVIQYTASTNSIASTNSVLNLSIAIGAMIVWTLAFILTIYYMEKAVQGKRFFTHYYQVLLFPYKPKLFRYPLNFILNLCKFIGFTIVVLIQGFEPTAQAAVLLAIEGLYILYLILVRPYSNLRCFLFQLCYEGALLAYIIVLLLTGMADSSA